MLSHLLGEVEVLLALHWGEGRVFDGLDAIEPLYASSSDVSKDHNAERVPVDARKRLAVHVPGQHDFICFDLGPWNADEIVHGLVVLEVGVGTVEFQVLRTIDQSATGLDDLLEADTSVSGIADCALRPWCLGNFVALARVLEDLLNAAGSRALHRDGLLHAWESGLIHDVIQRERLRLGNEAVEHEAEVFLVDNGDASVVSHEMKRVGRNHLVGDETLRRLSVVRELEEVQHVGVLLFEDGRPRVLGDFVEFAAESMVPHLPMGTGKHWVCSRDGAKLELGVWRERLGRQDLVGGSLLLGVVLPLDEAGGENRSA